MLCRVNLDVDRALWTSSLSRLAYLGVKRQLSTFSLPVESDQTSTDEMQLMKGFLKVVKRFFTSKGNTVAPQSTHGHLYLTIADWDLTERARVEKSDRPIFCGSYSDVYCAKMHLDGNRNVKIAVKELRMLGSTDPPLDHNPKFQRLFMEILIWSRLDHPNVAELYGFTLPETPNSQPTIISPWYGNCNLDQYLKGNTFPDRLLLLRDVASAVQYLHSLDIIHGDIKPENVLIDDLGRGRLCDFGTSHFVNSLPVDLPPSIQFSSDHLGHTSRFASPELLLDYESTKMSDMWALGCVGMRILTGHAPYGWLRDGDEAGQVNGDTPFSAYRIVPENDFERDLISVISTCWDKDQLRRPSAADFLDRIETLINQG